MVPRNFHILIPYNSECVTSYAKMDSAVLIKIKILKWDLGVLNVIVRVLADEEGGRKVRIRDFERHYLCSWL
jgi:hypothetical protein